MKIALTSTPFFGIFPPSYGGLEVVVGDLFRGLVKRGHKVVLFAPDESQVIPEGFVYGTGPALNTVHVDWLGEERKRWGLIDKSLDDFDIVNSHDWFGFAYASKKRNPQLKVCHTHHGGLNTEFWLKSKPPFKLNFIAISQWMKRVYESQGLPSKVIYNPVSMERYPLQKEKGDRLLFLGRIDPVKAPHFAVQVAKLSNMPIDIVGGTSFVTDQSYVQHVKTLCLNSGGLANFVGEVDHATKVKYLQNAKALLIPSRFGEPFGLIAVEAMLCGTPSIALNDGALKEVIGTDNRYGYICESLDEMASAVKKVEAIPAGVCREGGLRFSVERISEEYEKTYKLIVEGEEW